MTGQSDEKRLNELESRVSAVESALREHGVLKASVTMALPATTSANDATSDNQITLTDAAAREVVTPQPVFPLARESRDEVTALIMPENGNVPRQATPLAASRMDALPIAKSQAITSSVVPIHALPIQPAPTQAVSAQSRFVQPPPVAVASPTIQDSLARKAGILHYPSPEKPAPVKQSDFENTVGLKWAGWIGALVFVIGAVLGVKYAYDQGWFTNLIPNWLWLSLIASAGIALISAGEWVYRRINRISAAGLFAAGVATLFVASYCGHAYYEIYSQSAAFTLMAISAIVGAGVAIRADMVSIGVISLLGANIAPLLLGKRNAHAESFLIYLLATQVVALILAGRGGGGKWWALRGLSLASISFWMLALLDSRVHQNTAQRFTLIFAVIYQLELIITNWLSDRRAQPGTARSSGGAAGITFSMVVTAALTLAMLWVNADAGNMHRTLWVLGIAAVCGALGFFLGSRARPALTDLATGYALQALGLMFIAVPVYTSGAAVEIGWATLAVGLALIGIVTRKTSPRVIAMIAWMLAAGHLLIRNGSETSHAVLVHVTDIPIHTNAIMAVSLAFIGQLIAILTGFTGHKETTSRVDATDGGANSEAARFNPPREFVIDAAAMVSIASTLMFVITCLIELPMSVATFAVLVFGWGLIGISRVLPKQIGIAQGGGILILAGAKWLIIDAFGSAFDSRAAQMPVMLNSMNLSALVLIASAAAFLCMLPRLAKTPKSRSDLGIALRLVIAVIALVDLSIEISRAFDQTVSTLLNDPRLAKQVALSIFWACFAVASVGVGFHLREASLRYFGLILLAVTLLKVVTVDLSGVSQGYRILSFIGVGLLMLGTSVLYGKVSPRLLAEREG